MDHYEPIAKPRLVENGVKYFLNETLKQCRDFKNKYQNLAVQLSKSVYTTHRFYKPIRRWEGCKT